MRVREVLEELAEFDPDVLITVNGDDLLGIRKDELGRAELCTENDEKRDEY